MGGSEGGYRLNAGVVAGGIFLVQQYRKGLVQSLGAVLIELAEVPTLEQGSALDPAAVDLDSDGRVFGMGQDQVLSGVVQVFETMGAAFSIQVISSPPFLL